MGGTISVTEAPSLPFMQYVGWALILILVIQIGLCALIGYKKGMKKALLCLGFNVLAVGIALGLTKLFSIVFSGLVVQISTGIAKEQMNDPMFAELLAAKGVQNVENLIAQLLLAVVLFPILYLIFYFLLKIPKHIITKKLFSKPAEDVTEEPTEDIPTEEVPAESSASTSVEEEEIPEPVYDSVAPEVDVSSVDYSLAENLYAAPSAVVAPAAEDASEAEEPQVPSEEANETTEIQTAETEAPAEAETPAEKPKRKKADCILGIAACVVSGLLSAIVFPMTIFGSVSDVYQTAKAHEAYNEFPSVATEIAGNLAGAPIVRADAFLSTPFRYVIIGNQLNEVVALEDLALYGYDFSIADNVEDMIVALEGIRTNFNNSSIQAQLIADVISLAADEWKDGHDFLGVSLSIPNGMGNSLFDSLLKKMSKLDADHAQEDVNAIIDLFKLALRNNLISGIGNLEGNTSDEDLTNSVIDMVTDPNQLEELYKVVLKNDDISELIPALLSAGADSILQEKGITLPEGFELSGDLSDLSDDEIAEEAELTSKVVSKVMKFTDSNPDFSLNESSASEVGEFLDIIAELDNSKVAESVLPAIQEGIVQGLCENFAPYADQFKSAKSLSELANIFR